MPAKIHRNLHTSTVVAWKVVEFWLALWSLSSLHQITPLHVAAERGHPRIVEYLVDKGADIDIQDKNGVIIIV